MKWSLPEHHHLLGDFFGGSGPLTGIRMGGATVKIHASNLAFNLKLTCVVNIPKMVSRFLCYI